MIPKEIKHKIAPLFVIGLLLSSLGTVFTIHEARAASGDVIREKKDFNRNFVSLGADGVTPAIAETLITFSKNVNGTVTAAQTSYAITAGKTLRLQSICASMTAGAAANRIRVAVRLNTGGACVAGSGLLLPAIELAPAFGTAAAAEGGASGCVTIPDGLDLAGVTWNVCLTENATAASGTLTANLIGFEY